MGEQDPPLGPLRRLDPSEPDEAEELGRLEPLDPEAAAPAADPADKAEPPRPRDGLALAVALAVLLSLSSIGAIGGLVAVSVRTLEPAPDQAVISPIETAAAGPPIRVIEPAAPAGDSREGSDPGEEPAPGEGAPVQEAVAPPPAPPPPPPAPTDGAEADRDERQGGREGGGGKRRSPWRVEGAWCDAEPGGTCDVVVGGPPAPPAEGDQDRHPGRGPRFDS